MKIKAIIRQSRRDFQALYECEHCGDVVQKNGYDDTNFHHNVIPNMICHRCGQIADDNYRPLETKYPAGMVI